ncbi:MAG: RNA polymerase sigma factor [Anaerolineae bacterium]|nr:RNA polymerase sigma factor [Anaerolineae bacterium]
MFDFHDLYASYAPEVYRFAYWLTGDLAEAEDITSETFIRAWNHYGAIRTATLKAYLLQIARNVFLERLRKQKRYIGLTDVHIDPHPGPEKLAEEHAELAIVQRMLQALPEIDQVAFILRVQQELPYDEIARVLQISVVAAKVKVHRARKKLLTARMSKEAV